MTTTNTVTGVSAGLVAYMTSLPWLQILSLSIGVLSVAVGAFRGFIASKQLEMDKEKIRLRSEDAKKWLEPSKAK